MDYKITRDVKGFIYEVNRGVLSKINEFKKFVGEEKFNEILAGAGYFELPFDESEYEKLLSIIIENYPNGDLKKIPYDHAEELISFFCEPFAGRSLKQVKSTLGGISSLLRDRDLEGLKIMMESISSQIPKPTDSAADN